VVKVSPNVIAKLPRNARQRDASVLKLDFSVILGATVV